MEILNCEKRLPTFDEVKLWLIRHIHSLKRLDYITTQQYRSLKGMIKRTKSFDIIEYNIFNFLIRIELLHECEEDFIEWYFKFKETENYYLKLPYKEE